MVQMSEEEEAEEKRLSEMMAHFFVTTFIPAFLLFIVGMFLLASLGFNLGIRRNFVLLLLKVFEFGRKKIEKAEKHEESDCFDESLGESNKSVEQDKDKSGGDSLWSAKEGALLPTDDNREGDGEKRKTFDLVDACDLITSGIQAIVDDEVTKRFDTEELSSWNLLTRTNKNYHYISIRLTVMWGIGFIIRYCIFLPFRLTVTVLGIAWLVICTAIIGYIRDGPFKRWLYCKVSLMCFRILSRGFSGIITYHNKENRPKPCGICVANHTSPIDVVVLASDDCYALVGQRQGGLLNVFQTALRRAASHIWFERFEIKDRELVTRILSEHVRDPEKLPILIFPEGTCINNSAVMMFKKGCFEVGGTIYPVAIKYDPRFGDPFWNSSKHGLMYYLLLMMTSWSIVCDVWYLPPMTRNENESAIDFTNRVKAAICRKGGLVDLSWDGQLKRMGVKAEWKQKQQEEFSRRIKLD